MKICNKILTEKLINMKLTGKEKTQPRDQSRITEHIQFTYSPLESLQKNKQKRLKTKEKSK